MLYVVQVPSGSSYSIARYEVHDGFFGPVVLSEAERFRNFEPYGQLVPIGGVRETMLKIGIVKPNTDEEREIVQKHLETLYENLGLNPVESDAGEAYDFDGEGGENEGDEEPSGDGLPQGDVEVTPSGDTSSSQPENPPADKPKEEEKVQKSKTTRKKK